MYIVCSDLHKCLNIFVSQCKWNGEKRAGVVEIKMREVHGEEMDCCEKGKKKKKQAAEK